MLLLLIFVSLMNLVVNPVYGLINIKSKPAKVANGNYVQLVCDVGTMKNTVEWVNGGVTYFSCDPPYTNCFTNTSSTNNGLYLFSINDDSIIMILLVNQNKGDGKWSCYHGNDEADIEIDNADAPEKPNFGYIRYGYDYRFQCRIQSEIPADVVIYSQNYLGVRKLYERNQTNITRHIINTTVLCEDYRIFCNVSNGYGPPIISDYMFINKACPLKILQNISTTTWTFNEIGTQVEFKVYYEGSPSTFYSLHRLTTDSIQEVRDSEDISLYLNPQRTLHEPRNVRITFHHPKESDTGKYILILKQDTRTRTPAVMEGILITVVYTGETTTKGSDQKTSTTPKTIGSSTSGGVVVGKTKAENTIMVYMVYLGVTLSVYFGSIE